MYSIEKVKNIKLPDVSEEKKIIKFTILGEPINYVRERVVKGHAYNPKKKDMIKVRNKLKDLLSAQDRLYLERLLYSDTVYYVNVTMKFYLEIPKNTSNIKAAKMLNNLIRPAKTPDIDNLEKFIIDALHEVVYDDDKKLVEAHGYKYYSNEPRTELEIEIIQYKYND